jgi:hypothetical protein
MLKETMNNFIGDYAGRDRSVAFPDWLAERLQQEMPEMSAGASEKLSREIIGAVADYDKALDDLNKTVESGVSKEEWFAEVVGESFGALPLSEVGGKLQQAETGFTVSNMQLMGEIEDIPAGDVILVDAEVTDWNEYSVKYKVMEVGKQAAFTGLGAVSKAMEQSLKNDESGDMSSAIGQALKDGIKASKAEIKATVAGALKSAAERKRDEMLDDDTSTETMCDVACAAVEGVGAIVGAVMGEISETEAIEQISKAGTVLSGRAVSRFIKGMISSIPYVGGILAEVGEGLINAVGDKISEKIYPAVRNAVTVTWNGIKQKACGVINAVKNKLNKAKQFLLN